MNLKSILSISTALCATGLIIAPHTAVAQDNSAQASGSGFDTIVVTARKREENSQEVPVAITVHSGDQLETRTVEQLNDIGTITPGLSVTQGVGGSTMVNVAIRGQSEVEQQAVLDPAVGVYIDGIYFGRSTALNVNLYDLAQVEILKGPQGTLFGRNTTGGAVNITTTDPGDEFSGFVKGTVGNFDRWSVQGAVSIPLGEDLGLRVGGNIQRRDGFTTNALLGQELASESTESVRAKLVWTPGDLEVRLGFDYAEADQTPVASVATPIGACDPFAGFGVQAVFNPSCGTPDQIAFITGLYGPGGPFAIAAGVPGGLLVPDGMGGMILPPQLTNIAGALEGFFPGTIAATLANNAATQLDPFTVFLNTNGEATAKDWGGSGTISYDFGPFVLKSITGYREIQNTRFWDSDGTNLPLLDVDGGIDQEQFSQELQVLGETADGRLNYVLGYFFFREEGNDLVDQDIGGMTSVTTLDTDVKNQSHAVFAQLDYGLSDSLTLNLGFRHIWDDREVTVRHQALAQFAAAIPFCDLEPALLAVAGTPGECAATLDESFTGVAMLAGLDYELSDNVLAFFNYRKGYRSGGFSGRAGTLAQLQPVEPERTDDFELGIKADWDFGGMPVRTNAALFQTNIDNRQRSFTRATPSGGLTTVVESAEEGRVRGFEFELLARPFEFMDIIAGVAHIDAEHITFIDSEGIDRSDEPVPQSPEWSYNIGTVISHPLDAGGNVDFAIDYSWLDSQSFGFNPDPTVTADSYGIVNIRAGWSNAFDKGISIHGFARNLTDKEYVVGGVFLQSNFGYSINYYGEPRTYGVEVGLDF